MARVGLVTLLAALALAGCGGGDSGDDAPAVELPPPRGTDTQQIQETWRLYYTSLAARDGGRACALLTERGRDEVVRESSDSGGRCEEVVAVLGAFFKGYRSQLREIRVSGDSATAVAPRSGEIAEQALEFKRDGGRWKIDHSEDAATARDEPEEGDPGRVPRESDEEGVRNTWGFYTEALGREDGKTVCALLTEKGQREVLSGQSDGSSCEEVVAEIGSFFKGFETELTDVKVQGDVAEGVSPARGQVRRQVIDFRRVGGRWKIDGADDIE